MEKKYVMLPIKKSRSAHALFFNEIDFVIRFPEEEFINYGEQSNNLESYEDDSVRYYYNSLGFRSDEFTSEHDGKHILFSGCSETEGLGGNLDSNWAYIAYNEMLKKEKLSGFFNLSKSGWGHEIIISNIMAYINKYGKPDNIYILFPNIGRFYEWKNVDDLWEVYSHTGAMPNSSEDLSSQPEWKIKISIDQQRKIFISFVMIMKLFEEYCNSNNIKLIWSTWDLEDAANYNNANIFKNFIKILEPSKFIKRNKQFFNNEIIKRKNWERKRDGHHGYFYHYLWAKHFLGQIDTKEYE